MKETHAFRNPLFPGQRIIVRSDGAVMNSRTRNVLAVADGTGGLNGACTVEFKSCIVKLLKAEQAERKALELARAA